MIIGRRTFYADALTIPEGRSGSVAVRHVAHPAGRPFPLVSPRGAFFGQRAADPVIYDRPTSWHALTENGVGTWMTDLPIEQRQADGALVHYRGRVLVGGLGLGYAVTALSHKRHVSHVTVVERSGDVAGLVWPHTRRSTDAVIVAADLFDFLRRTSDRFDRGFFDIWQSDNEQTFFDVVVPLRALAVGKVKRVDCWNEDVMRGQLVVGLLGTLHVLAASNDRRRLDEELTTRAIGEGAIFVNWALPFWRWYRRERPPLTAARAHAVTYAQVYGLPSARTWIHRQFGETPDAVEVAS